MGVGGAISVVHVGPMPRRVDVERLADDARGPAAVLDGLDAAQDQLGVGLAHGRGTVITEQARSHRLGSLFAKNATQRWGE